MQNSFQLPSILSRSIVLPGYLLVGLWMTGCGENAPTLETTQVTHPVGQPGLCAHCNEKIENVAKEHLMAVRGNQYIVCDEQCAADLKEWLAKQ